jgi:hypothetical protein
MTRKTAEAIEDINQWQDGKITLKTYTAES